VPSNVNAPAITGSGLTGASHTCSTGDWSGSPTSYAYQWKDDGVNVGTNANTYTPVTTGTLTCVVTASNATGAGTPTSSAGVTISAPAVPANTVPPVVSGTLFTGSPHTCTTGTWTLTPTSYSYQWKDDGVNVGTDSNTYTPVTTGSLTCTVTASNASGAGTPQVSNTATIAAPTFEPVSAFAAYSDSATGSTMVECETFTPTAGQPLVIVVHALQESSASRALALKVTIGTPGRGVGTGTTVTAAIAGNNSRVNTAIYVVENPSAVSSSVQVSFDDGVNADEKRCIVVKGWRVPGGATTATVGGTVSLTIGNGTSLSADLVTAGTGSIAFHAGTVSQLTANITVGLAGATELLNTLTGTAGSTDLVAVEAWEAAATAGTYDPTWSWTGSASRHGCGIEIKAA
jgi:hypothetical protein